MIALSQLVVEKIVLAGIKNVKLWLKSINFYLQAIIKK